MDTATTGRAGSAPQEAAALAAALARYRVAERSDGTEFHRKARLLASLWREEQGLAPGTYHPPPRAGRTQPRVLGSRLEPDQARAGKNFLTPPILQQVRKRLAEPETHQLIKEDRLWVTCCRPSRCASTSSGSSPPTWSWPPGRRGRGGLGGWRK